MFSPPKMINVWEDRLVNPDLSVAQYTYVSKLPWYVQFLHFYTSV